MSARVPREPLVLPSVMSADMLALGAQLDALIAAGAGAIHVDVMDGHFVPNLTVGPDFARAAAGPVRAAGGLVDVHLMVSRPAEMVPLFAPHADAITVHVEADPHPHRLLGLIRDAGCAAGLALNPGTPVEHVAELAGELDYVNVLAVNPGFAGQSFIATTPARIARLRALLPDGLPIEVDGGIGMATMPAARDAGATMFVSASSIFGAPDPVGAFRELDALARAA
ncbi:ribulose-phosphate 3-epimerase [Miltoncostaea marina]|uniref:ribulose-phosphate 3-epimerase n=1 Tax=Miltoncostaea marina TaxID=2843215 RepID=UPI001C3CE0D0|nr:ribulose-phosphate 3-epimerase [Miltoncostaea marina]